MIIRSKYKKIDKRRRGRELALDTAKQKSAEGTKDVDMYSALEFVEDTESGTGTIAVAGAAAGMNLPTEEALAEAASEAFSPSVEPDAPKLISVGGPVFESDAISTVDHDELSSPETAYVEQLQDQPATAALPAATAPTAPAAATVPATAIATGIPSATPTAAAATATTLPTPAQTQAQTTAVPATAVPATAVPAQPIKSQTELNREQE